MEMLLDKLPDNAPQAACDLLDFWHRSRQEDGLPSRTEFSPVHLGPWLDDISIYEYVPSKNDFQIVIDGENIVKMMGEDWRGGYAREIDFRSDTSIHSALSVVRETEQPQIHLIHIFRKDWSRGVRLLMPVLRPCVGKKDVLQVFMAVFPIEFAADTDPFY
ncbi:PAS domain-containing protein [Thalassospira alkalitolerans]|uniref:PAS domain-containing protein n=1 Tax=Thalassospira alkalitolerans TaxID=1293890 RepID=UPI0030EE259B|tara:strand:- start:10 stop:492 length:483 start_codon:yes stop_codon:yes gene_type:complete